MAVETAIEWADATANFWAGCTQISPGCDGCYAMKWAKRMGIEWNAPPVKVAAGAKVARSLQRKVFDTGVTPFVFVNSLSDFFDKNADPEWRREAIAEMVGSPDVVFLILTKRIGNVVEMVEEAGGWPENAWLGASFVNQLEWDRDFGKLMHAQDALNVLKLFVSLEPLLGPIVGHRNQWKAIDSVIVGGESGMDARPMHPDWPRSIRDQCEEAGAPFMFKQWGEWSPDNAHAYVSTPRTSLPIPAPHPSFEGVENRVNMYRVGKKLAGRLLDGVEHNGRPAP